MVLHGCFSNITIILGKTKQKIDLNPALNNKHE